MPVMFSFALTLLAATGPVDQDGRPLIRKLGTVAVDLVETTPIVFNGTLYRFQWDRPHNYFDFVDHATSCVLRRRSARLGVCQRLCRRRLGVRHRRESIQQNT